MGWGSVCGDCQSCGCVVSPSQVLTARVHARLTDVDGCGALGDVSGHRPAWDGGPPAGGHRLDCCLNSWDESGMGAWHVPPVSRAPCPGGRGAPGPPESCCTPPLLPQPPAPGIQHPPSHLRGGSSWAGRGPLASEGWPPRSVSGGISPRVAARFSQGPTVCDRCPLVFSGPLHVAGIFFLSLWSKGQLLLVYRHCSTFRPEGSCFGSWSLEHEEASLLHVDPRVCPWNGPGGGVGSSPGPRDPQSPDGQGAELVSVEMGP